ncbi:hypothetical protein AB0300_18775 [Microbacterium sp. NPDC078814]|uniref:hypothetical protein n=1 Tax=Microbacterium sp. NPDC078814 TaxID=3154767 RepID=UPI00344EF74C
MSSHLRNDKRGHYQRRGRSLTEHIADETFDEDFRSTLDSLRRLVQVAGDTGRDWKLVDALLRTMIELVLETAGDLFVATEQLATEPVDATEAESYCDDGSVESRLGLRPEYGLRLEAVIDSWSDDETADFLMIGLRQVQRLARRGKLYYFLVDRRRRYPIWQFDRSCGVLGGVAQVAQAIPHSWSAWHVYEFMTTRHSLLSLATPAQWLLMNHDPESIVAAIGTAGPT